MSDIGTIPALDGYNARMSMSMIDKIFFADKIYGAQVIVDFGCADATMIKTLRVLFPDFEYIGFDVSPDMLVRARQNIGDDSVFLTSEWDTVKEKIAGKKSVIVLSSLIHEVYTYCSEREIDQFWERVWDTGFDYVVIRELVVSNSASRPSDPISVARVRQLYDREKIQQWENRWGSLNNNWSLVHFFLTYQYTDNWDREYKENYLPVPLEDFLPKVPKNYFPEYYEHYTLPFLRRAVHDDFGVQLQEPTHLKLIYERKQFT